jgi:glutamate-1-semialdehyde 2,1-aminomutase
MWELVEEIVRKQPTSILWNQRAERVLVGGPGRAPYLSPILPVCLDRAEGAYVTDVDSNRYIDCHLGNSATILGHRPPEVVTAVEEQLARGLSAGQFFAQQVELGELVCEMVPSCERVAFFHSGGEAIHAGARIARAATGRRIIAKFEGCYHGWGELGVFNSMMSLSGRLPRDPLDRIAPRADTAGVSPASGADILVLPYNHPIAFELIRRHAGELAAVILDPVPPFMTAWIDEAGRFARQVREVTQEAGVPWILVEVVSGFRLAPGGAQEYFGIPAEMAWFGTIASGLGSPVSMVGGKSGRWSCAVVPLGARVG